MKLCALNSTVCCRFSSRTLVIRERASLDPRPAEVQMFRRLYNTAHTHFRPREMPPIYTRIQIKNHINDVKSKGEASLQQISNAIMKYATPLTAIGHDASISKGSARAEVRWVQDSHTSAESPATKSYCGLRTKLCPRSCANLKQKMKNREIQWLKTNKTTMLYVWVWWCTWWRAQQRWSCTQGSALRGESGGQHRLWGGERADSRGTARLPTLPVCGCRRNTQLLAG